MYNRRKHIDSDRRNSQRKKSQRIARMQREFILEMALSNLCQEPDTCETTDVATYIDHDSLISVDDVANVSLINVSEPSDVAGLQSNVKLVEFNSSEPDENENESVTNITTHSSLDEDLNEITHSESSSEELASEEFYEKNGEEVDEDNDADVDDGNDDEEEQLFENIVGDANRNFTSVEIAIAISLLKSRHVLTNSCVSNICRLLKLLGVTNAPGDFRHVRSLICGRHRTTLFGDTLITCPSCHSLSTDSTRCSSTLNCINKEKFTTNPTVNYVLKVEPQIRTILQRNHLIKPNNDQNIIRDIIDASIYREIKNNEPIPIITLLINSDGAVVKSISRSIWITTFVINELPPAARFNRENIVIGMVSVGSVKPKKVDMQLFLKHLVKELLYLETDGLRYTPLFSPGDVDELVKVFLIAAVCDKPATSLLINHTEAGGYYGCIHCKIIGENVKVGGGCARVFVNDVNDEVELRSNDTYDAAIEILQRTSNTRRRASITSIDNGLEGLRGACAFRDLKYFDVYQSFLSDTLHTLYEGVTARMLNIFFDNVSLKNGITQEMSIRGAIDAVSAILKSISYPSTTYRIPREINQHHIYKANEYKMILLFGYNAFDHILDEQRYNHFKCLAFASHLIESSKINHLTHHDVRILLKEFTDKFELFYTKQQAKPVIHSLNHFASSIENYGPSFRYSTFEFESTVASLTRLIHNGNAPLIELLRSVDLLQQTWLAISDSSFSPEIKLFDKQINASSRYAIPTKAFQLDQRTIQFHKMFHPDSLSSDVTNLVAKYAGQQSYKLYKTVIFQQQRFSADPADTGRRTHDGCLMYMKDDLASIGFLETVVSLNKKNEPALIIRPVNLMSTGDTLSINDQLYRCTNVLYGSYGGTKLDIINLKSIVQKLAFRLGTDIKFPPCQNSMFFFQYPNRSGST